MTKQKNRYIIPNAVVIKGQLYTVTLFEKFMDYYKRTGSADSVGLCDRQKKEIFLHVEGHKEYADPEHELYMTYLHEITHAICGEVALNLILDSDIEEIVAENISRELFQVIDNQRNIVLETPKRRKKR